MGTLPAVDGPASGTEPEPGLIPIGIQQYLHAPKLANPLDAGDHSLQQQGEAMERAIAEEEDGHGSEPPNEVHDSMGGGLSKDVGG